MATYCQHEEFLRRLAINDESTVRSLFGDSILDSNCVELDAKTTALVRLAAVVALDSRPTTVQWSVSAALAAGASEDAIVDVLVAVVPVLGSAQFGMAAPVLAAALGYPVERDGPALARSELLQ
jgi:alkylhydroperoxidase/carboxymuconolactone decarboxylase family protein YurZ